MFQKEGEGLIRPCVKRGLGQGSTVHYARELARVKIKKRQMKSGGVDKDATRKQCYRKTE